MANFGARPVHGDQRSIATEAYNSRSPTAIAENVGAFVTDNQPRYHIYAARQEDCTTVHSCVDGRLYSGRVVGNPVAFGTIVAHIKDGIGPPFKIYAVI